MQVYGGSDQKMILRDYLATQLLLDQNFPPAEMISNVRDVGASSSQNAPSFGESSGATPSPAVPMEKRPRLVPAPALPGLDLSTATLSFQFAYNQETSSQRKGTAHVPSQLFADSNFIADIYFGLPWMLRCDRSEDGYRIAFNTGSDGTSIPDDSLRWLDLRNPQEIYQPLPSIHVSEFVFSKDGNQIALLGRRNDSELFIIYVLDVATGEAREIISIRQGYSLVWSPDEETLAFIGLLENSEEMEAVQIHVRTGLIAFRDVYSLTDENMPEEWPMSNWGKIFPKTMGGMERCSDSAVN